MGRSCRLSETEVGMWRSLVCLGLLFAGCAHATTPSTGTVALTYGDPKEYIIPTNLGVMSRKHAAVTGVTHYLQVNTKRICYRFEVPGTWEPGREPGLILRLDRQGFVGVWLFGVAELGTGSVEEAIQKAAERSAEQRAKEWGSVRWNLTPYPKVAGAWHWAVPIEWTDPERPGVIRRPIPRWYIPVGEAWIAQFTIGVPPEVDHDAFVTGLLTSLTTSREPRCYEAELRRLSGADAGLNSSRLVPRHEALKRAPLNLMPCTRASGTATEHATLDSRRAQPRARHLTECRPQLEAVRGGRGDDGRPGQ